MAKGLARHNGLHNWLIYERTYWRPGLYVRHDADDPAFAPQIRVGTYEKRRDGLHGSINRVDSQQTVLRGLARWLNFY